MFWIPCNAQHIIISGKIKNETGNSLQGVNVLLINPCVDSTILSFTSSDINGRYVMVLKHLPGLCKQIVLTYSTLDYLKKEVVLDLPVKGDQATVDVSLIPKTIFLNEVIVREKPKGFKQLSDTTHYNVSQFTDGTERKLEDILKKLPGISVSENGAISFKGKNIEKILIEGEDFFSRNYTILSKNISAGLVESIDALENFNDEKLLKGITRSDNTALNLKLKKGAKATVFGDANLGAGTAERYTSSTNIFSFIRKVKVSFLGNINNIGDEAIGDIQYDLNRNEKRYISADQAANIRMPVKDRIPIDLEVNKNRYVLNKSFSGGLQFNYAASEKLKLNFYSFINTDKQRLSFDKRTTYLIADSNVSIFEKSQYDHQPRIWNSNLKLTYQLSDHSNLVYNFSLDKNRPDFIYGLTSYPNVSSNLSNNVNGNIREHIHNFNNRITYTSRITDNKAIVFDAAYLAYKNSLYQLQDTNRFSYLNDIPQSWNIHQNLDLDLKRYEVSVKLLGTYKWHTYLISANFDQNISRLHSFYYGSSGETTTTPESLNQVSLKNNNLYLEARDLLAWQKFEVSLGFRMLRTSLASQNMINVKAGRLENYLFLPKLSFRYKPNSYSSFTVLYEKSNTGSAVTDIYLKDIITDHLNTSKGNAQLNNNLQTDLSFRYRYSNPNNQWIMNFTTNLHLDESPYTIQTFIHNQQLINVSIPAVTKSYYFFNRFQSDKYVRLLQSNWRVVLSQSQTRVNSIINNGPVQNNILNALSGSTYIITALDIPVNFQAGSSFSNSILSYNEGKVNNNLFKYDISSNLKCFKFVNLKIIARRYVWTAEGRRTISDFVDMKVGYRNPTKKWVVMWNVQNILNAKSIAFNENDTFIVSQNTFYLQQRYFMLSFEYRF